MHHAPPAVFFITSRCQNACRFCFEHGPETARYETTPSFIAARLAGKRLRDTARVDLIGGEPLMHPAFEEIARGVAASGRQLTVTSNGLRLADPRFARRVLPFITGLVISVHGGTPAAYRAATGNRAGFAKLGAALVALRGARPTPHLLFNTTLTADTLDSTDRILTMIAPFAPVRWDITNPFPAGLGAVNYAKVAPRVSNLARVLPRLSARACASGVTVRFSFFPACAIGYRVDLNNDLKEPGQARGHRVDHRLNPHHRGVLTFKRAYGARCASCALRTPTLCAGLATHYLKLFGDSDLAPLPRTRGAT